MTATRRLAAILAADVAGYSRPMGADEEVTFDRLKAIRSGGIGSEVRCAGEVQRGIGPRSIAAPHPPADAGPSLSPLTQGEGLSPSPRLRGEGRGEGHSVNCRA
jgi:hypothetical protein